MPKIDIKIISIGTLSQNPLWNENRPLRTPHATTTLVTADRRHILVDPALPPQVLDARLFERAGIRCRDITTVFLTTFRAAHRMGLPACENATWTLHADEQQFAQRHLHELQTQLDHDPSVDDELALLDRCRPAPDEFADGVQLFPSPGPSLGSAALILTPAVGTLVVAGDAIVTTEHLERGQVWEHCHDLELARHAIQDILEVADFIVPGHDNVFPVMGKLITI